MTIMERVLFLIFAWLEVNVTGNLGGPGLEQQIR